MSVTATKTITVRLPMDLFNRVEASRGRIPREVWARDAFEAYLGNQPRGSVMSGSVYGDHLRSQQAKAGVTPVEKAGK